MFRDFLDFKSVLEPFTYKDQETLVTSLGTLVNQVEMKVSHLIARRAAAVHIACSSGSHQGRRLRPVPTGVREEP
jgi:hypothetical protein